MPARRVSKARSCLGYAYYSEKYRHEKYELNEELVKPYLQLDSVKRGVFLLANKLYGLNFTPNPEVPVYHPR